MNPVEKAEEIVRAFISGEVKLNEAGTRGLAVRMLKSLEMVKGWRPPSMTRLVTTSAPPRHNSVLQMVWVPEEQCPCENCSNGSQHKLEVNLASDWEGKPSREAVTIIIRSPFTYDVHSQRIIPASEVANYLGMLPIHKHIMPECVMAFSLPAKELLCGRTLTNVAALYFSGQWKTQI